jgi:hypothetical protein
MHSLEVQVFDIHEMEAVARGDIEGTLYNDGDVYAEVNSLEAWRASKSGSWDANGSPIPVLPLSDAVTP